MIITAGFSETLDCSIRAVVDPGSIRDASQPRESVYKSGGKIHEVRGLLSHQNREHARPADLTMTRILVVDDYPPIAELIRIYIRKTCNADVDVCHSAHVAIGMIQDTEYDVIISDYDMREMNGIALIRHLKQSGVRTPFILMTGVSGGEIEAEAGMLGAVYIFKGDHPARQISTIIQLIRRVVQDNRMSGTDTVYS